MRQNEQAKKDTLSPKSPTDDSSQDSVSDTMLEDNLKQNEINLRLWDIQLSPKTDTIRSSEGNTTNFMKMADYTVLLYMIGSDLELKQYSATEDLREMLTVGSTDDVNVIVETGGSKGSVVDDKRFIDFTTLQRHKILKHHHQTLEELGKQNMATSNTLSDFLKWGVSEFPAKKYVVILWDHGSGVNGFGKDSNFKGDILTPIELAKAFEDSKDSTRTNFDIIGFDACFMATIEVANTVKSFGNYMVASQELIPPSGWDYSAFLTSLVKNPSQDGLTLGKNIADTFQNYYRVNAEVLGYDAYLTTTTSIVDLHKISDLVSSMNDLARYLNYSISDVNSSKSFARLIESTKGTTGESDLVDIHDLTSNVLKISPDSFDVIDKIQKMLGNAVIYKINGDSKPSANGLSIYLPNAYRSALSQSNVNSLDTWQQIVNKQYYFLQLDKRQPTVNSQTIGKNIIGWVDRNDVANVTLSVVQYSSNDFAYYTEELEPSKIINKNGYFRYFWDGEMISLCNNNECSPTEMSFDSNGYNKFAHFPVNINTPNSLIVGLNLLYDINESEGRIKFLGAIPEINTNDTVSKERYKMPLNSSIYTIPVSASSDMQYLANLFDQSYDVQSDKSAVSVTMSMTVEDIISSYNTYKEKGFLPVPVNGDNNFTQLPGAINVTDHFGPRYKKYDNESYLVFLSFCDYSNNCRKSSSIIDAKSHDNNISSTNKDNSLDSTRNLTDFDSYQNTNAGIKINYPKKWSDKIEFGKINDVNEEIMSYKSSSEAFSIVKDPSNNLITRSPKQYATQLISEWARKYPDFNLVESRPTILSGKIAHKIVLNYTEGQNRLIDTQVVSNNGANTYQIHYVCLAQDYSHNISTILRVIRSFAFIDESIIVENPVFLTYENPVAGITMQYKSDWERYENSGILPLSPVVSFFSPLDSDNDRFREQFNFHIQQLPSNFSPQNNTHEYVDNLVRSSFSSSSKIDKISSNSSVDYEWYLLAYRAKIGNTNILVKEIWKIIDDKLYRIELICELEKCIQYSPIHNRMIGSLSIHPSESSRWNLLTYEDPSSGIRTQYPFDWKLASYNTNQLKESGKIVEFWPISSTTDSRGVPDISVTIHTNESKSNVSIDKIANNHVKTYRKQIPNFKLLEMDNSTSFSGLPAFKLIVNLGSDSTPIRGMIVGTVLDDKLYRFTYVSPPGKFDAYLSKVMNMMESFKIGLE